jgi:hypothetical protein
MADLTPAALRRLADRKEAEAHSLNADAERLRREAGALRGVLEPLIALSSRVWVGPAASEFEENTRSRGRLLDLQANRLDRIADELVDRARRLRSEAASLRAQATAAEATTAAGGTGVTGATPGGVI